MKIPNYYFSRCCDPMGRVKSLKRICWKSRINLGFLFVVEPRHHFVETLLGDSMLYNLQQTERHKTKCVIPLRKRTQSTSTLRFHVCTSISRTFTTFFGTRVMHIYHLLAYFTIVTHICIRNWWRSPKWSKHFTF